MRLTMEGTTTRIAAYRTALVHPFGRCQCGCGTATELADRSCVRKGWVKGLPKLCVIGHVAQRRAGRSREEAISQFWSYVSKGDGCWLWTSALDAHGYGMYRLEAGKSMRRAHRLAWEIINGPIPAELVVCHRCDNPPCVRPDHLFLGTQRDNMHDCVTKGRMPRGEQRHSAKLTEDQVRSIRALRQAGQSRRSVARTFEVSSRTVLAIESGSKWSWVE